MNIRQSTPAYERWLKAQLRDYVFKSDLDKKHKSMRKDSFQFLRATYWRWAETILDVCPDLAEAPPVLAVGDIHLENFGTWRDLEGRLVWGINDFDEAAEMPYLIDLVRLAVSANLAPGHRMSLPEICASVLDGYRRGVEAPQPLVLDVRRAWLREAFEVPDDKRTDFWNKMDPEKNSDNKVQTPPSPFRTALNKTTPTEDHKVSFTYYPRHNAGLGSLGRPRWVGYGAWRSAPLVREAKAMVPSAWTVAHGGPNALRVIDIARGVHRSPDPWYRLHGTVLVRRLSPNNRKLELKEVEKITLLLNPRMLRFMGRDLAAAHLGTGNRQRAVANHLAGRKPGQLRKWVQAATASVLDDYKAYGGK